MAKDLKKATFDFLQVVGRLKYRLDKWKERDSNKQNEDVIRQRQAEIATLMELPAAVDEYLALVDDVLLQIKMDSYRAGLKKGTELKQNNGGRPLHLPKEQLREWSILHAQTHDSL